MSACSVPAATLQQGGECSPGEVCEYVLASIASAWGPQLPGPDPVKVIEGFCGRFGNAKAMMIAREAFITFGGSWHGAPVTIRRFQASQDSFFAFPLLAAVAA